MVISYFLLNKGLYEIYEYTYDIRKIFLVLHEIRKFVKYIRNANTNNEECTNLKSIIFNNSIFKKLLFKKSLRLKKALKRLVF